jgi:hypothetical protein
MSIPPPFLLFQFSKARSVGICSATYRTNVCSLHKKEKISKLACRLKQPTPIRIVKIQSVFFKIRKVKIIIKCLAQGITMYDIV